MNRNIVMAGLSHADFKIDAQGVHPGYKVVAQVLEAGVRRPVVTERFWLYAAPAALLALALLLLFLSWRALQRYSAESELKRQAQADFALLRALAQKKTEG